MNKFLRLFLLVVLVALAAFKPVEEPLVKWYSFEEAVALNEKHPKKLMVDVYTNWCGWCKVMDEKTFNSPEIASYLNEHYYPVKLNAEQKEDILFQEHTFKYVSQGSRGYHELAATLMSNKLSYPTVVILNEDLKIIQQLKGFLKPEQFKPILHYIGEDHYKNQNWKDFENEFNGD